MPRDRRKTNRKSRRRLPVGAIRIRRHNGADVRFIKYRSHGPTSASNWRHYAAFVWEIENDREVPQGMRVIHIDGNELNDEPENLDLASAADVITRWHRDNPELSEENRRGRDRRQATADHNALRARVRRRFEFLPRAWYAVFHSDRRIDNRPARSRRLLLLSHGLLTPKNGRVADLAIPFEAVRGAELMDERFAGYSREGDSPCLRSDRQLLQVNRSADEDEQ